jgi:hypothetical protein
VAFHRRSSSEATSRIARVDRVVLLERARGLVLELLNLPLDGATMLVLLGGETVERVQARADPQRREHAQQLVGEPPIHRRDGKCARTHLYSVRYGASLARWLDTTGGERSSTADAATLGPSSGSPPLPSPAPRASNYLWAELMQRTFGFDVLACARCGGRLRLLAVIEDRTVVSPDPGASGPADGGATAAAATRTPTSGQVSPSG